MSFLGGIKSGIRIAALLLWTITMLVLFGMSTILWRYKRHLIPAIFHSGCCRIFAIKLIVEGKLTENNPALFVSNHLSYLDIFILGSQLPAAFISKSDVAHWPLLGQLAHMQNTLFIERNSRHAKSQIAQMQERLKNHQNLILFPEGTSTPGTEVIPFKSTLFKAAEIDTRVAIQPVCISYHQRNGGQLSDTQRDHYSWYGDMPFVGHFLSMAGMSGIAAKIQLLEPVYIDQFDDRKLCSDYCQKQVADALKASER